jgi:pyridoxine 4-dehydrogenase
MTNDSTKQNSTTLAAKAGQFAIGGDRAVARLGFGAMRITGKGVWGDPPNRPEAIRVLRRAVELGVNFIDTADSYGPRVSEELVAEALHPYPANLVIATKGGNRIDLYQLHRIDPKVPAEDQLGALKNLQAQGKIKHIGLSEVSVRQLQHAQKIVDVVTVQNRYSLTDRGSEDVLDYCERHNMGFIPWFPLAAGRLSGPSSPIGHAAAKAKATPSQVALAWLLWRSPVLLPIPGTSNVQHLEENIAAAGLKLDEAELNSLRKSASAS